MLREAEKQVLGYDHQQIAAELLQSWSYPPVLVQAVAFHHAPESSIAQTDAAVVHVADHLINAMGIGSSGEQFVPPLDDKAWTLLGLETENLAKRYRDVAAVEDLSLRVAEGEIYAFLGLNGAGKTGTAQKVVNGQYSSAENVASFVGFLPAEAPEFAMVFVVDEPQPLHQGGVVAAPAFGKVASQIARYLDIPAPEMKVAPVPFRRRKKRR